MLARASDSVLLVVDIQERLAAAMEEAVLASVVRNTRILLAAAAMLDVPTVVSEQYPRGLGPTIARVCEKLPPGTQRIEKTRFSAAEAEPTGRKQVVLAGMEAHVCVLQTALDLLASREVFVVEDACCSRTEANRANAMNRLRAAGVTVTNTESVLFEWMRDARNPQFKVISALVK